MTELNLNHLAAARMRYDDIAKQIEREDGLVNIRTTWLLGSEALLFGGVGLLATKAADVYGLNKPGIAALLLLSGTILLTLGAFVASRCRDAIIAASAQLTYLKDCWERSPFLKQRYSPPFGNISPRAVGIEYPVNLAQSFLGVSSLASSGFAAAFAWCVILKFAPCHWGYVFLIGVPLVVAEGVTYLFLRRSPPAPNPHGWPESLVLDCAMCLWANGVRPGDVAPENHAPHCKAPKPVKKAELVRPSRNPAARFIGRVLICAGARCVRLGCRCVAQARQAS